MSEVDDLYGLALDEFVPRRDALAKRLRADGRREEAAEVGALRKPSVAARRPRPSSSSRRRSTRPPSTTTSAPRRPPAASRPTTATPPSPKWGQVLLMQQIHPVLPARPGLRPGLAMSQPVKLRHKQD